MLYTNSMNIYIYQLEDRPDLYKIGQTHRDIDERIAEQVGHLPIRYKILFKERIDGITDYDIMAELEKQGVTSTFRNEWYNCSYETLVEAIETCKAKVSKSKADKDKVEWYISLLIILHRTKISLNPSLFLLSILLVPFNLIKTYIEYKKVYINKQRELSKIKESLFTFIPDIVNKREISLLVLPVPFIIVITFLYIIITQ